MTVGGKRIIGLHGSRETLVTLIFMALHAHKGRLRSLLLGGSRLTVMVVYDRDGAKKIGMTKDGMAKIIDGLREAA